MSRRVQPGVAREETRPGIARQVPLARDISRDDRQLDVRDVVMRIPLPQRHLELDDVAGLDPDRVQSAGQAALIEPHRAAVGQPPRGELVAAVLRHLIDRPGDPGAVVRVAVGEPARDPDRARDRALPADRAPLDARVDRHRARRQQEGLDGDVLIRAVVRPPGPLGGGHPGLDAPLAVEVAYRPIQPAKFAGAGAAQVIDPALQGEFLQAPSPGELLRPRSRPGRRDGESNPSSPGGSPPAWAAGPARTPHNAGRRPPGAGPPPHGTRPSADDAPRPRPRGRAGPSAGAPCGTGRTGPKGCDCCRRSPPGRSSRPSRSGRTCGHGSGRRRSSGPGSSGRSCRPGRRRCRPAASAGRSRPMGRWPASSSRRSRRC